MAWQLQQAKQQFSQVVRRALAEGPQIITRHGEVVAVVLSATEYTRLTHPVPDFKEFLRSAPDLDALDIRRDKRPARAVEL